MAHFDVGEEIDGRYEVLEELGQGGMGVVLRVRDSSDGSEAALKYCPATETEPRRRFRREVRIMASIDHDNVMPVLDHNLTYKPPYFVMPLAASSIAAELSSGPLAENDALAIFKDMCLGVQAVHNSDSTHRDLKPDNTMRMGDGRVVISDLGLARLHERDTTVLTQTAAFLGTRMYCAPEQLLEGGSRAADPRTDIFQLGKCLYELVTGDSPALIDTTLIPSGLEHIIDRATKQHPDHRYQTVGQLMDALESYVRAKDPNASPIQEFEAALQEAKSVIREQRYSRVKFERVLDVLLHFDGDEDLFIEQFERIPRALLQVTAQKLPDRLEVPLERYCAAVEHQIGGYNFAHAETVAKKMKTVFDATDQPRLAVLAVKATMVAAVDLNRFAAMEVFDAMLLAIDSPGLAVPVAEMLQENLRYYSRLADRVPTGKLHSSIRHVQHKAQQQA